MNEQLIETEDRAEIQGADGIVLRQLIPTDANRYFELIDADRTHFKHGQEVTPAKYPDVESVRRSIEVPDPRRTRFGIWENDVMVGSINLTDKRPGAAELGYWVGGEYKGSGYAHRAVVALTEHVFNNLGITELVAWVSPKNVPSIKTLEKSGFRQDVTSENETRYVLDNPNVERGNHSV